MHGHAEVSAEVNEPRVPEVAPSVDSAERGPGSGAVEVDHKLDNAIALLQYASIRTPGEVVKSDLEYAIRILNKVRDGSWYPYPEMCYKWQGCPFPVTNTPPVVESGDKSPIAQGDTNGRS